MVMPASKKALSWLSGVLDAGPACTAGSEACPRNLWQMFWRRRQVMRRAMLGGDVKPPYLAAAPGDMHMQVHQTRNGRAAAGIMDLRTQRFCKVDLIRSTCVR